MNGIERDDYLEHDAPSLGAILKDLSRNTIKLIRGEIRLAAGEVSGKAAKAVKVSQLMAMGAFLVYAGILFILAAAAMGLSMVIQPVWAVLIVGVAAVLAGAIMMLYGKKKIGREGILPSETINTFKKDAKWMREQFM